MNTYSVSAGVFLLNKWKEPNFEIGVIKRENGQYGFPAGMLEPGETAEECALRELKEETGYTGRIEGLRCVVFSNTPEKISLGFIFNATIDTSKKRERSEYNFCYVSSRRFFKLLEQGKIYKPKVHLAGLNSTNSQMLKTGLHET